MDFAESWVSSGPEKPETIVQASPMIVKARSSFLNSLKSGALRKSMDETRAVFDAPPSPKYGPMIASELTQVIVANRMPHLKLLVERNYDVNAVLAPPSGDKECENHGGWSMAHEVALKGNAGALRELHAAGLGIDKQTEDGWTPVHAAAYGGKVDALKALLEAGSAIDVADVNGRTALHWACICGDFEVVRLLLWRQASLDTTDRWGQTPVKWAQANPEHDVGKLVLKALAGELEPEPPDPEPEAVIPDAAVMPDDPRSPTSTRSSLTREPTGGKKPSVK